MASVAPKAAVASLRGNARAATHATQDAATAAWLCALPCAALVALMVLLLGPPLGGALFPADPSFTFLYAFKPFVHREPTEEARYLLALGGPLIGALAIASAPRWLPRVPARAIAPLVLAAQACLAGVVVASILAQYRFRFGAIYQAETLDPWPMHYFDPAALALAAAVAVLGAGGLRQERVRARLAPLLAESRSRRWAIAAVAVAVTVVWLAPGLHSDASIAMAPEDVLYHLSFTLDETFAVLNGRTPLVDFTTQYAALWPYAVALPMLAFGESVSTFTAVLCAIGALSLLAVYDVLRRVTRSSVAAILLYAPFVAMSLFMIGGPLANRSTVGSYFGTFPLRYAGPWLVAWLTVRRLERAREQTSSYLLFTVAGLVLLNNTDFGLAALGATVAALLWSRTSTGRDGLVRLVVWAASGLATALVLVSALTLWRSGSLPHLERLGDYARLYAIGGYALMPIPGALGIHLLIYLTYVAAIVVATVRSLRGATNRLLTGMLAWSGVFGLGAAAYYVGRSHPVALKHQFGAWTLALALLTVVAVHALGRDRSLRATVAAALVLLGFGTAACSLAQLPLPWTQASRLGAPFVALAEWRSPSPLVPPADAGARAFVASLADGRGRFVVRRGAPVAIMLTTGHRTAHAYGVVNVTPYTGKESLETVERVDRTLDALRAAGGNTLILPAIPDPGLFPLLSRRGFEILTPAGLKPYEPGLTPTLQPWPIVGAIVKWVDTRHLHPRALD